MSGGAEMVAAAIGQRVASKLGSIAWERIELLWSFKEDVQEMEDKMVALQVALSSADKHTRGTDDALVQHWLKKYKSLAYDIEDALDELEANALIWKMNPKTLKLFFSSINPLFVRITMSNKMRSIRLRLHKIAQDAKRFNFVPPSASTEQTNNEMWRETYVGGRDDVQMVGKEREKKYILHEVLSKHGDRKSSIIPIVGLGGMGKTTVAKFVYTHKETTEFDLRAWVHVSMEFDLKKILCDIIYQLDSRIIPAKDTSLQHVKSQLDHIFSGKLYLIVLDDLWEGRGHHLEDLVTMLQSGEKGSKIIVTTRSEKVASTLSVVGASYFHIVDQIKLEGLSDYECWSIMKPRNLGDDQSTDLVDIGQEISRRCNGVPLVAKALGYVMRKHCTREAWIEIKDNNILDIKDDDKGILKGLLLSYHHMAPPLKLCFMYCSIFPKSHEIDHDILIQQWIALGFIQDADDEQPLQILGTRYVEELFGMSFLTSSTSPTVPTARIFKPTLKLRMHDMVHDLAKHVAGDELSCINLVANSNIMRDRLSCHYQLLLDQNSTSWTYKDFSTKVRALHLRGCKKLPLPNRAFSHTLCLRVLDLGGCHMLELPNSLYKLKLLRYLDASSLPISTMPKFLNRLLNLQTLIISNTCLKILPTSIDCLRKLQYFDLSGCVNLSELPLTFGFLSDLLFLNLARCHKLRTLPVSFGKLRSLQVLNLSDCYRLHSLPESFCLLHELTHLDLSDCHSLEMLPDRIDQISRLEYLNMTSCSKIQMLPESLCKLMMLKHLNLSFCVNLEHLPSSIGNSRLERLDLEGCFFLGDLPDSIFSMSTLVHVERTLFTLNINSKVEKLGEKLNLSCELDGGNGDLWSLIEKLEKTPYHELRINHLENAKHLEGAEQAKLSNNSKLTRLILLWEHAGCSLVELADKSVLEKLMPPRSLQHLGIYDYMSMDFPRWMLDIPSYIPNLTTIFLVDVKGCNHLPQLGRLPNLRALGLAKMPNIKSVGSEFYGNYGNCQKLRMIVLHSMDNLEEWWTTRSSDEDGEFLIPNLHQLGVADCPKLKFLPYPPRSVTWTVANSDHVLPERGFRNLSSTTCPFFLVIGGALPSSEVWRRARYLSSIEGLQLRNITGLRTLPEAIQGFTNLRKLDILLCADLETLPQWLGDFTSLRKIRIDKCPKLSSLPRRIRSLTELELRIVDCPALENYWQEQEHRGEEIAHTSISQVSYPRSTGASSQSQEDP